MARRLQFQVDALVAVKHPTSQWRKIEQKERILAELRAGVARYNRIAQECRCGTTAPAEYDLPI
jgi:hypothetical protein